MVLILDGSSEMGAYAWSQIGNLIFKCICLDEELSKPEICFGKVLFSFTRAQDVLSNHLLQVQWRFLYKIIKSTKRFQPNLKGFIFW